VEKLRRLYRQTQAAGIVRLLRTKEILAAFAQEQIAVMLLKGAALNVTVYRSNGLRPMLDLDLLVRGNDLEAAHRILCRLGYLVDESYRSAQWYKNSHHHLAPYVSADGRTTVELHHDLVSPEAEARTPVASIWERARPIEAASQPAFVPAPEHLLLSLCLHVCLSQSFESTCRDLADIAEIIVQHGTQINWHALLSEDMEQRAARSIYYSLWITQNVIGTAVPADFWERLKRKTNISCIEDSCLKFLIPRAVFPGFTRVPDWFSCDVIGAILSPKRHGSLPSVLWERIFQHLTPWACERSRLASSHN
jgi:hypothetical protein